MIAELHPLWELLNQYFDQARSLIDGLTIDQLNWRPIEGETEGEATNSLYGMTLHISFIALNSAARVANRAPQFYPEMELGNTGLIAVAEHPERALELLKAAQAAVHEMMDSLTTEQLDEMRERRFGNWVAPSKSVRWMLTHVLDHTALHVGHMEITRQLLNRKEFHQEEFRQAV